eukprot:GFUD01019312.1.p1 GENE.GFUD01019312.1~~GFUD01019312.1.p1  ORF type:complete len:616 (-),score=163.54 GFUD01019312.1:35-1882(-)
MLSYCVIPLVLGLQCVLSQVPSPSCVWPDWTPDCGQPACPDCRQIRCVEELSQDDCPGGTFLADKKMFGCCPACVKYQDYGQICPGVDWENTGNVFDGTANPTSISYGDDSSGDLTSYPDTFIHETVDLPCSLVHLREFYSNSSYQLQERVTSVEWAQSRDGSKMVPLITSPHCRPDLICQKLWYLSCEKDVEGGFVDCSKFSPGTKPEHPIRDPTTDPYPICNAIPTLDTSADEDVFVSMDGYVDEMDCENQPCTCRALDYQLWAIKQWGEDCSQHYWNPACDAAGLFSGVQFKVSSEEEGQYRWCSSPTGEQLFGKEQVTMEDSEMTCSCSQKRWELEQEKMINGHTVVDARKDVSVHCKAAGSYETLQCDKGRCWCVEEKTGAAISIVVPETLIELLPCFDERDLPEHYGNQYLRKCENRAISILKTKELLGVHGTQWSVGTEYECDQDGSFAPVQCDNGVCHCYSKSGQALGAYGVETQNRGSMSCRCARDEAEQLTALTCQGNGDYNTIQSAGGAEWCASPRDGWRISGKVPDVTIKPGNLPCCLDSVQYHDKTEQPNPDYPTGGYILWEESNKLSYACRQDVVENEGTAFERHSCDASNYCQTEIMKCQ